MLLHVGVYLFCTCHTQANHMQLEMDYSGNPIRSIALLERIRNRAFGLAERTVCVILKKH